MRTIPTAGYRVASKVRLGIVGLGKMGISHLSLARAHPRVELIAVCDNMAYLTSVLEKHTGLKCYPDLTTMLGAEQLDAVIISTPSRLHAGMVREAMAARLHVFCEKPFVLDVQAGESLVKLATEFNLVTQVGYHNRFVGAFQEAARIAGSGALGRIHHVRAEAFGPVVLKAKGGTWRSNKVEGGGALYDYACHAIDLAHFVAGPITSVSGVVRHQVFSHEVEDEVYCTLHYSNGCSGQLSVNWSDESNRKMSSRISIWGTNGKVVVDRQECQLLLRTPSTQLPEFGAGWTVRYTTELTSPVWFYVRGEEYSAQLDYFISSIEMHRMDGVNSFKSALETDRVVDMIQRFQIVSPGVHTATPSIGWGRKLVQKFVGRSRPRRNRS